MNCLSLNKYIWCDIYEEMMRKSIEIENKLRNENEIENENEIKESEINIDK